MFKLLMINFFVTLQAVNLIPSTKPFYLNDGNPALSKRNKDFLENENVDVWKSVFNISQRYKDNFDKNPGSYWMFYEDVRKNNAKQLDDALKQDVEQKYIAAIPLKDKDLVFYNVCKKMQWDLGLQNVNIKFYHANLKTSGKMEMATTGGIQLKINNDTELLLSRFYIVFNTDLPVPLERKKLLLRHEFAHVEQRLLQSEGIRDRKKVYEEGIGIQVKNMNDKLMEQAADATACGECEYWKCIRDFKAQDSPLETINEQGYCVSPTGYLSYQEVMQYADVAKECGQLCDMHAHEEVVGIDSLD